MSLEEILEHLTDYENYRYMNKGLALGIRAAYEYLAFVAKQEDVIVCGLVDEVGQDLHLESV